MTQTIAELNKKKNLTRLDLKRGALALVKGLNVRNKKINAESEANYIKAVWDNFQLYEMALSLKHSQFTKDMMVINTRQKITLVYKNL